MTELGKLVTVTLDKERHLRLSLKGMLEFEKITGKNLLKGFKVSEFSLEQSAALLYACLLHEDKELTYDDVLRMVDVDNMADAFGKVTECLTASAPHTGGTAPLVVKPQDG